MSIEIRIAGDSHSEKLTAEADGLPAGLKLDTDGLRAFAARRAPGRYPWETERKEADEPVFLSGLENGILTGETLRFEIKNTDVRTGGEKKLLRPSHADYTSLVKYGKIMPDRFSGRMTAPICTVGAICAQYLREKGIIIAAHALETAGVHDVEPDMADIDGEALKKLAGKAFPTFDDGAGERMIKEILRAKADGDSVGGIIRCYAVGFPAGYGGELYDGIECETARNVFAIPAVRGISFGAGFGAARMRGSEHNDPFVTDGKTIKTEKNDHGGILGGISSGMPIVFDTAIKPTPSIAKEQRSVDPETMTGTVISVKGRNDPCIVPRAVPCIEAAAAIALYNVLCGE